jgi:hypothetical protein
MNSTIDEYVERLTEELDAKEEELLKLEEEISDAKNILDKDPDKVWTWFCDAFNISYYNKNEFFSKLNDLIEDKLKKSTYYEFKG